MTSNKTIKGKLSKIVTIILTVLISSLLFYFITINQGFDISTITTTIFKDFNLQTELFSMGIPNGGESLGVPSIKCPKCEAEGVEVWVIFGKACPRCGNPCD